MTWRVITQSYEENMNLLQHNLSSPISVHPLPTHVKHHSVIVLSMSTQNNILAGGPRWKVRRSTAKRDLARGTDFDSSMHYHVKVKSPECESWMFRSKLRSFSLFIDNNLSISLNI